MENEIIEITDEVTPRDRLRLTLRLTFGDG